MLRSARIQGRARKALAAAKRHASSAAAGSQASSGGASSHPNLPASTTKLFDKLLIANRGEIACRVIRTAKRLGVKTVSVFSDADRNAQHVQMADEAVHLGGSATTASYLRPELVLDAALQTGAQAIHPGYGFLSENEGFARAITQAGLVWVGPPERAIRDMGSKSHSKQIMTAAGVPVTPGYWGDDQSPARMTEEADKIGFPVMLKAVKGGGGKGMRVVHKASEMPSALEACQREAKNSFGDSRVLVEKYLPRPRHVELQVFADSHGDAVYLWERDCSVQRRHQKVLEEAPAPGLHPSLREAMGASAVAAAKAVGYVGAGTVEFMVDETDCGPSSSSSSSSSSPASAKAKYYFMEMNTRLQVEHPVTEMITGTDLVEWQLRVAAGGRLPLTQQQINERVFGHAIEARVYAENPSNNFLPATGTLKHLRAPAQSPLVRVDTGVRQGDAVSIFYDPMISKLIAWGETRDDALRTMSAALKDYQVVGLPNNLSFLQATVRHPLFVKGGVDTSFLAHHLNECLPPEEPKHTAANAHHFSHPASAAAVALAAALEAAATPDKAAVCGSGPWSMASPLLFSRPGTAPLAVSGGHSSAAAAAPYSFSFIEGSAPGAEHAGAVAVKPNGPLAAGSKGSFTVTLPGAAKAAAGGDSFTVTVLDHRHVEEENAKRAAIPGFVAATTGTVCKDTTAVQFRFSVASTTPSPTGKLPGSRIVAGTLVTEVDAATGTKSLTFYPESSTDAYPETSAIKAAPELQPYVIRFTVPAPSWGGGAAGKGRAAVVTPMPGKVVKILTNPGTAVTEGTPLMVLEAMKMEHIIKAPTNGTVSAVNYKEGDFVNDGAELVAFKAGGEDEAEGKKKAK